MTQMQHDDEIVTSSSADTPSLMKMAREASLKNRAAFRDHEDILSVWGNII